MDLVYLDNNATTQPDPAVVEAMFPFFTQWYGNPSSIHRFGQRARAAVDEARAQAAALLGCSAGEITFTGGGTEATNLAVRGLFAARSPRRQIITTTVEHSATRELCAQLAREGADIVKLPVDIAGQIDLDELRAAVTPETALVTMLWANNETGVLFPIEQAAALCRQHRVPFHCDGTQAIGKVPADMNTLGVDAMTFAAHKFHGPKGVGGLFIRKGVRVRPQVIGSQEHGRRGGTENVPGIVGMGVAAELARQRLRDAPATAAKRDRLEQSILSTIEGSAVNGDREHRVPNTTNIGFERLEAEAILLLLSEQNICASAGAACSSGSLEPSPILLAMGVDPALAHGSIRLSLSHSTTDAEIDRTLTVLPNVIEKLRAVLPVGV